MTGAQQIRQALTQGRAVLMPGVYDALSARIAALAGFDVLFITGYGVAASDLGLPDLGYLTQTEMADAARRLCPLVPQPVIVDGDTGYGGVTNVRRTVDLLQRAGAAGIFLEDQTWPKRCGHLSGKQVVPREEWLSKLQAVLDCRGEQDLFLVARTDAREAVGLEEAIERARLARELVVDAVFVEASRSLEEMRQIAAAVPGPHVANMIEKGLTPLLTPEELHDLGFDLIVSPLTGLYAAARGLADAYAVLKEKGTLRADLDRLMAFGDFNRVIALEEHLALDRSEARSDPTEVPSPSGRGLG